MIHGRMIMMDRAQPWDNICRPGLNGHTGTFSPPTWQTVTAWQYTKNQEMWILISLDTHTLKEPHITVKMRLELQGI